LSSAWNVQRGGIPLSLLTDGGRNPIISFV
jgi:hypothetical protein